MEFQGQTLLQEAARIGDQLLRQSVVDGHGRYWKTVNQVGKQVEWEAQTCLYNGVSGIALFLLMLYQQTQEDRYRTAAVEALAWTEYRSGSEQHTPGLLAGHLSLPFAWLSAYQASGDGNALSRAPQHTHSLLPHLESVARAEYLHGIAGTIIALLHLHAASSDPPILKALDHCVTQLLSLVQCRDAGLYWDRSSLNIRGLCGFSHGASGVGYAFLELGHYFQNPAFDWIAEQAFRYERAYYHSPVKNWLDFRKSAYTEEDEQRFQNAYQQGDLPFFTQGTDMNAWCHGAVGIGLARLHAYQRLGKLDYQHEALLALEKTEETELKSTAQPSFTLCHGRGGNAELFIEAFRVFEDSRYWQAAQRVAMSALGTHQQTGRYRSGTLYEGEDASLFNGIAGIGYFYLRTLFPREVPSILAPKLTSTYHGSINPVEFPGLSLSRAEVQERLLEKRFPRTVHLIRHLTADFAQQAAPWFASTVPLYQRFRWQAVLTRQVHLFPVELQTGILDAWTLEDTRAALDENIVSDALLWHKQHRKARDAERLRGLDDRALSQTTLLLDPDIFLLNTYQDWSSPSVRHWEKNLRQAAGEYVTLLIPTVSGIYEQPINAFVHTLLEGFQEEKTVAEGMQALRSQLADAAATYPGLEALMLLQIREAIRAGLLINALRHPIQAIDPIQPHHTIHETP